jgi:hypothetical protein
MVTGGGWRGTVLLLWLTPDITLSIKDSELRILSLQLFLYFLLIHKYIIIFM